MPRAYSQRQRRPLSERFWSKVAKRGPDECWLWTGSIRSTGYGQLMVVTGKSPGAASRISWELHHGAIPAGLYVCHKCDVRACVNPAHLFLGTHADNMRDCSEKGRGEGGWRKLTGEAHPLSKLTATDVAKIRSLNLPQRKLAAMFGVSQPLIGKIKRREGWRFTP